MNHRHLVKWCLLILVTAGTAAASPGGYAGSVHRDDGSLYLRALAAHNYQGTTAGEGNIASFPWSTTPSEKLLKYADPLDLCLSCHDGVVGIPDVVNADVNGLVERSAGFFDEPDVLSAHGHNLGHNPGGLCMRCHWSQPEDEVVTCIDCHNPHGNGNPRNLQWASDPDGTPPLGLFNPPGITDLSKYERANTAYGTSGDVTMREVTNICIDCHHVFSGPQYTDSDGDGIHERHPTYDSERGQPNTIAQGAARGTTNPAHWEAGTGQGFDGTQRVPFVNGGAVDYAAATVVDANTNGVFCLSCHKAHGSANAFSLVWDINGGIDNKGCDQCHLGEGR